MKKNIFLVIVMLILVQLCKAQFNSSNYDINATISGDINGKMVYLKKANDDKTILDSTKAKAGKFRFVGHINNPQLYNIIITKSDSDYNQYVIPLFVENSKIQISAILDSIPLQNYTQYGIYNYGVVNINGSISQDIYSSFLKEYAPLSRNKNELFMIEYNHFLQDEKDNTSRPLSEKLANASKTDLAEKKRDDYLKKFIMDNKENMVGLYIAQNYVYLFSKNEIESILSSFPPKILNSKDGKIFKMEADEIEKSAPGSKYTDFNFKDIHGKNVKLSDKIGRGNYVLLEFWASWCAPCRAEIPHLKEVYNLYHPSGFDIVSVSMDDDNEKWSKAASDENMNWLQVSDLKGMKGNISKLYNFSGIPTCVLLDPEGIIVSRNMRGAWLDQKLIDIYGNKFEKN